jgi:hypothetical protein
MSNKPDIKNATDAELQAFARCLWENQANLINQAADFFDVTPSLVAILSMPVLFQAIAQDHGDREGVRKMVNESLDKGFDEWLRQAASQGGVQ